LLVTESVQHKEMELLMTLIHEVHTEKYSDERLASRVRGGLRLLANAALVEDGLAMQLSTTMSD
jgi:hypothetical protein